ncbi:hypothetical protein [uncultured Helicobacter sp.]|uniref:hypothetical protein n=1 Tax=uncultured Helicobacter sp. TaxID=175537 RepID=UPI00261C1D49|nr:hypothetical protein [uncultured Helicobacter sp.]
MATRSYIFVSEGKSFTDQVKGIYCHWDGYVEGVGKTLKEHYNTDELANALINLGDISSLE